MSETGVSNEHPDCDDTERTDQEQETDLPSMEHSLETRSNSTEDIISQPDDGSYYITWTFYIALAVPREVVHATSEKANKMNRDLSSSLVRAQKARSCYHIEYKLLPGDSEVIQMDLVVFGAAAKLYKEDKFEVLKTWHEGDHTWVGWTQDFNVRVNKDTLISLLPHKVEMTIWNGKEKLSWQALYDRMTLRALRLPQNQSEDEGTDTSADSESMIEKLRVLCKMKSKTSNKHKHDVLLKSSSEETDKNLATQVNTIEDIHKQNVVSVEVSPLPFFAGETSVAKSFPVCSAGMFEVMCSISLDRALLNDQLKAELNPLVITILSVTSMPSYPVPFHILQEKCMPVYCQYKFHNLNMHRTNGHEHASNIYFGDVNVILTGLMSPGALREFLSGPPLQIEVHDRDRKLDDKPKSPATFGTGSVLNSYGAVSLNLSDLLIGRKSLKVQLPIKCCPLPPKPERERSALNEKMVGREPIPPSNYIEANSYLKVKVEIACPLNDSSEEEPCHRCFGRIIYLFDYNNVSVATKLRSEILGINASAFNLGSCSLENMERALSNYIMNFKPDESNDLDIVTGFHVQDKRTNIFILEGLKNQAVRRLWKAVPMKLSGDEEEQVIVLYNSTLSFFKRIYDSLDLCLSPIHLRESLQNIMKQPKIYIRGKIPQPCFQALSSLSQLCQARLLKDVVHYNFFPTAEMILSMKKEYGTDVEQLRQEARMNIKMDRPPASVDTMKRHEKRLGSHNREYIKRKRKSQHPRDFIQENIEKVKEESDHLEEPEAAVIQINQDENTPAHNYSIQTFNTNVKNRELLCEEMAKMPGRRFTYSQQYHSATVEPGDMTPKDESGSALSTVWVTNLNSDKSNVHPRQPDEARVEELRKPWRENILHANILKPPLSRDIWVWNKRHEDFQLYPKPPPFFSTPPVTIHLAGESLKKEQHEAARAQDSRWPRKLLPPISTGQSDNGPISESKCHTGGNSKINQDVLKTEPKKCSLRKPGPDVEASSSTVCDEHARQKTRRCGSGAVPQQKQRPPQTHHSFQQGQPQWIQEAAIRRPVQAICSTSDR